MRGSAGWDPPRGRPAYTAAHPDRRSWLCSRCASEDSLAIRCTEATQHWSAAPGSRPESGGQPPEIRSCLSVAYQPPLCAQELKNPGAPPILRLKRVDLSSSVPCVGPRSRGQMRCCEADELPRGDDFGFLPEPRKMLLITGNEVV